ncbi:outer membrane protein [Ancylobacter defluvii]|uniref:Membrane protein n=1 Tax=Ancylobacter defluvii TaxID=1282440 RepID=A0A9W6NC51_9HYPH|nr:outer membrane protein [Ancylobacter defluvii]MBS7586908.1 porin family protein [Ancylobacter defluvii]GLK86214.1 membrane protein [Ancylobacter defluvii]
MKKLLLAAVSVTALASPALAADLATQYPVKAAVVAVPVFTWTGFYIGANLGYTWSDGSGGSSIDGYGVGSWSGSSNGFTYGGQLGYNYQVDSWVFGVEADIQGVAGSGSYGGIAGSTWYGNDFDTDYFGTLRGRIGYAWDRVLVYGTAGAAYGQTSVSGSINGVAYDSSADYWTWTVGAGVEYAFADNWTVKGEYLYIGDPDTKAQLPGTFDSWGHINTNVVRLGVNYKF